MNTQCLVEIPVSGESHVLIICSYSTSIKAELSPTTHVKDNIICHSSDKRSNGNSLFKLDAVQSRQNYAKEGRLLQREMQV